MISHVWFDLDGTLTRYTAEFRHAHDTLMYSTYAKVTNQKLKEETIAEFDNLYQKLGSVRQVFISLGLPINFWQTQYDTLDSAQYVTPLPEVIATLARLRLVVPVSLFTNASSSNANSVLAAAHISSNLFSHILTSTDLGAHNAKPSTYGFQKIIELSNLSPGQILFIGDRVKNDILPAKAEGLQTCLLWGKSEEADFSLDEFEDILLLIQKETS